MLNIINWILKKQRKERESKTLTGVNTHLQLLLNSDVRQQGAGRLGHAHIRLCIREKEVRKNVYVHTRHAYVPTCHAYVHTRHAYVRTGTHTTLVEVRVPASAPVEEAKATVPVVAALNAVVDAGAVA